MGKEYERKFKVCESLYFNGGGDFIQQGYLAHSTGAMVRVRTLGDKGFLTIKCSEDSYASYEVDEYEYEIPFSDAEELLKRCSSTLTKTRYCFREDGLEWTVDEFHEGLQGLLLAEFEHEDPEIVRTIPLPDFVEQEVTEDKSYSNFSLALKNTLNKGI